MPDVTCQTEQDHVAFGVKRNPCSRNVGPKSCIQPRTWHVHCVRAESKQLSANKSIIPAKLPYTSLALNDIYTCVFGRAAINQRFHLQKLASY